MTRSYRGTRHSRAGTLHLAVDALQISFLVGCARDETRREREGESRCVIVRENAFDILTGRRVDAHITTVTPKRVVVRRNAVRGKYAGGNKTVVKELCVLIMQMRQDNSSKAIVAY